MNLTAIIEIPIGCDRRIHMAYDGRGFVDLGPIKEHIPVNEGVMPINYGYINGTLNKEDDDEVDVIVFSKNTFVTGDAIEIEVLGMITREDGDHKIIARDETEVDTVFETLSNSEKDLILGYIGYKSPIISVDIKACAVEYINSNKVTLDPLEILKSENFPHIFEWYDKPGTEYDEHLHQDKVSIFIMRGDLYFTYSGESETHLKAGDRLDVVPGKKHTARAGAKGCRYMVGEMIEGDS